MATKPAPARRDDLFEMVAQALDRDEVRRIEEVDIGDLLIWELQEYVMPFGDGVWLLKHPLLFNFTLQFKADLNRANYLYAQKLEKAEAAFERRDWDEYLWLHGGENDTAAPQLHAFLELLPDLDERDEAWYWHAVSDLWTGTEFLWQFKKVLPLLFSGAGKYTKHELLMTDQERAIYDALPDRVTVWRGCAPDGWRRGWSWTLNRATAAWFAGRFNQHGLLLEATVPKQAILAVFIDRSEDEVVINPKSLPRLKTSKAPDTSDEHPAPMHPAPEVET